MNAANQLYGLFISLAVLWIALSGLAHMVGGEKLSTRVLQLPLRALRGIVAWMVTILLDVIEQVVPWALRTLGRILRSLGRGVRGLYRELTTRPVP